MNFVVTRVTNILVVSYISFNDLIIAICLSYLKITIIILKIIYFLIFKTDNCENKLRKKTFTG